MRKQSSHSAATSQRSQASASLIAHVQPALTGLWLLKGRFPVGSWGAGLGVGDEFSLSRRRRCSALQPPARMACQGSRKGICQGRWSSLASCLVVGIQTKHEAVPVFPLAGSRLEMRSRGFRLFFFANYRGPKSGRSFRHELLLLRVPCLFVFQRETTQKGKPPILGVPSNTTHPITRSPRIESQIRSPKGDLLSAWSTGGDLFKDP